MKKQKKKQQQSRINTLLKRLYTDVSAGSPALFTSVEPLYREAKKADNSAVESDNKLTAVLTSGSKYLENF